MKSHDSMMMARGLATDEFINHRDPQASIKQLIPARLAYPVELEKAEMEDGSIFSSATLIDVLTRRGVKLEDLPFKYYRGEVYAGKNRRLDNTDAIKGKSPLYDSMDRFRSIYERVNKLVSEMVSYYSDRQESSILARMEMEDLEKVTQQQWKPTGWFLQSPICEQDVPDVYHNPELRGVVRRILSEVYRRKLGKLASASFHELALLDDDPPDTMTGAPLFASGERTHTARWLTLSMAADPGKVSPAAWVEQQLAASSMLGFPGATFFSPVVATRFGPFKKPCPLWYAVDGGYQADWTAIGLYNRIRFVYPAPYAINFCLSPLYVQMSSVRKQTLGLWHDPQSRAEYIKRLRSQGRKAWSIDFSGMDTAMWKPVILMIMEEMEKSGLFAWSAKMFQEIYPLMEISLPNYAGSPDLITSYAGNKFPWCSGFKLTSEMDSLYGLCVLLSCLEHQRKGILDDWISGKFVICALGDDICFTTDFDIDADRLADDALKMWGAKLKILEDAMFLKWCLPICDEIPVICRTFARVIQQSFYNEDRYDGVEGGTRPDAVMRLALTARLQGLRDHPDFSRWWPALHDILCDLKYMESADAAFLAGLRTATPSLSQSDVMEIYQYSQRVPAFFDHLQERAKYEPSAAALMQLAADYGLAEIGGLPWLDARKWLLSSLEADPASAPWDEISQTTLAFVG